MTPSRSRAVVSAFALVVAACDCVGGRQPEPRESSPVQAKEVEASKGPSEERLAKLREEMVERQLAGRDITDQRLLKAMGAVPRHLFVPQQLWTQAYADYPLPIGLEQTISQPYVVAFMTQALRLEGDEKVLEIGTGSGYQAAVLAALCREVYSIEIIPELSKRAAAALLKAGAQKVELRVGDGYRGWPEEAPFDAIIVTAAPPTIPQPLVEQLALGGRMIVPVGDLYQDLVLIERTASGVTEQKVLPVRFVPMTGEAQKRR